ncbi:MAG: hypothetical protein EPO55_09470 [Reyranella sp.]|uniref:phage tail tip lysozyme n=1 Tax=Reyranella sp. TaxID=1929291 RepID=UPI001206577A|nr:phage tail tip lysozyme [Reyranella sp.]TAJ40223.1 MAG: hypothetical protein EPO55_09470 [Reyranella sp.]
MADFTITQDTPLFEAANIASKSLGVAEAGTEIQGEVAQGFVKTRIDSVAVGDGFIAFQALRDKPTLPQPIADDRVGAFIALVTRMARDLKTDRDYLLAVAYAGTNNLKALGEDPKPIGPFQYKAEEWAAATTGGPARGRGFTPEDRYRWSSQAEVATCLTADLAKRFEEAVGAAPKFTELYFAQLYGEGALDLLKGDRASKCSDVIKDPAPSPFAAELKAGGDTIGQAVAKLELPLMTAYLAARVEIDKQPPVIRYFRVGEAEQAGDPPWVTVARAEMARGVSETPENKNTADIQAYLKVTGLDDPGGNTPWCGAFLAFCMKTCGIRDVEDSIRKPEGGKPGPAHASWWETWGSDVPAAASYPVGTVVVLNDANGAVAHVGLVVGSDAATLQVLGGNQGSPGKVSIVPYQVARIRKTRIMSVPVPAAVAGLTIDVAALQRVGASATPADADFVARAPGIVRDLMRDLPGLAAHQAGGILGNIGHECAGFRELVQLGMAEGTGGMGWCQWDGARRVAFLKWANDHVQPWRSPEANYSYLVHELRTTEAAALKALMRQTSLEAAVVSFDERFERSGVKALDKRVRYARLAMIAFGG